MKHILKKTMAFLLAFVLLVGVVPVNALTELPEDGLLELPDGNITDLSLDEIVAEMEACDPEDREYYAELKARYIELTRPEDSAKSTRAYRDGMIWNEYLEVAVQSDGKFTIGNVEGNPNYTSDNNQILLYGHPSPGTSETLIKIGSSEFFFNAENVYIDEVNDIISANMTYNDIIITQTLTFIENTATGRKDNVRISYSVINSGSESHEIGIRIMMDTMLANNDHAPFKVAGYGNVTEALVLEGSAITQTYQVYDDLDSPTTMANGVLWLGNDRRPDKVQYSNWGRINDSGWDHYVSNGDYLGDSSVAIYFNPVTVAGGTSMGVSTYYGTGLGLASGTTSNDISNVRVLENDFAIYVLDSKTNKSLSGAEITLDGIGTLTTNASGYAVFENISAYSGSVVPCTVTCEGYAQKEVLVTIVPGNVESLYIKNANDNTPLITSATMVSSNTNYNDINLLSANAYFNSNEEDVQADRTNSYDVSVLVESDMPECVYQLISDNSVVQENTTGVFSFKVLSSNGSGKTYTRHRIIGLDAGKKVYVKAISADGNSSQLMLLGIKVSEPSSYSTNIAKDFNLTTSIKLSDLGDAAEICSILFGTKNLELKEDQKLPLEISIDEDGKVRAAYNLFEKDWETTEESFEKIVANRASAAKAFGGRPNSFGLGNAKVDFSVAGYGEGYISDGALTINLGIYVKLEGSAEYTHTFFLGFVPVYIKVGASAELNAELGATIINDGDLTFKITTGVFEPSFSLYAEAGAGISGMLSVGVQGKGTLTYKWDVIENYHNLKLQANASIELHAFLFHDSLTIAEKTWTLYDSYRSRSPYRLMAPSDDTYRAEDFALTPRNYLSARSGDINELNWAVYTDARPLLVQAGTTQYRLWIDDDENRTEVNRTALMCSVYDEEYEYWNDPICLDEDGTADFAFDVAVVGNDLYVVYQESKRIYSDEDAQTLLSEGSTGLATMAADSIISLLKVTNDSVTDLGTVADGSTVGSTAMGCMIPKIYADNNEITVVWTSNSANDMLAENDEAINYIWYTKAAIADSEPLFATAKYLDMGTTPITTLDVGSVNNQVSISYVLDMDQDFNTFEERKLYLVSGIHTNSPVSAQISRSEAISADYNPTFTNIGGQPALIWYENGNFCYFTTTADATVSVFGENTAITNANNGYAVLNGSNGTAIVWCAPSSKLEDNYITYSLYAVKLINGTWGIPYEVGKLSQEDTPSIRSLSGILDAQNNCVVSCAVVKHDPETFELLVSSLNLFTECKTTSFQVKYLDYDYADIYYGNTATVMVTVQNTGTVPITEFAMELDYSHVATADLSSNPLIPGETRDIPFEATINVTQCGDYYVNIYAITEEDDWVDDDLYEELSVRANYADIFVKQGDSTILGNCEYYTFTIENKSNVTADNTNFKVLLDDNNVGAVICDEMIGELGPQEKVTIRVRKDLFGYSTVAFGRLTTSAQEINTENNNLLICNNVEIPDTVADNTLTVKPSDAQMGSVVVDDTFTAGENGAFTKVVTTNDAINISAVPTDGNYAFVCWEITGSGSVDDKYEPHTQYYMGDGASILTAKFMRKSPITGISIPNTLTLEYGQEYAFAPVIAPADYTDYIIWSTDDDNIVSVDADGYIVATGVGTAVIRAVSSSDDSIYAETTVTVTDVNIESLRMVYPQYVLDGVGAQNTLNFIKMPQNATEGLVFESSDTSVVTVDQNGVITSVGSGLAMITVRSASGNAVATAGVMVNKPIEGIYFEDSYLSLHIGEEETVSFIINPTDTTEEIDPANVVWSSSNPNAVTVTPIDNGTSAVIRAEALGSATISVTVNGVHAAAFNVEGIVEVESLDIIPTEIEMLVGTNQPIDYTVTPIEAQSVVYWSSSDYSVAYVENGTLYAVGIGTATITLTSNNGISDSCTVVVSKNEVQVTDIEDLQSSHEYENSLDKTWIYQISGAEQITLLFSEETLFESGYDNLYICNGEGQELYVYTNNELANVAVSVPGDTVRIRLVTDGSVSRYGFRVVSAVAVKPSTTKKVKEGATVKLTAPTAGTGLTYQWESSSNGKTWKSCSSSSAKKATFSFTGKTSHNGNYYRCKVTDSAGNVVYTGAARLYVLGITTQPTTKKVESGDTVKFTVKATGSGLKYQWQSSTNGKTWKNCSSSSAKKATFSFSGKTSHNGNYYRCKVTDSAGNAVYTSAVRLYVLGITTQPTTKKVESGETVKFTVKATGSGLKYQWQSSTNGKTWKNCSSSSAKKATFSFTSKTSHNGNYYRCKVTDSAGNVVYTSAVRLYVLGITQQPVSKTVTKGKTAKFTVEATGASKTYQWQVSTDGGKTWKNCSSSSAKTATFSFTAKTSNKGNYYRCRIKDSGGNTVYTNKVKLTVK